MKDYISGNNKNIVFLDSKYCGGSARPNLKASLQEQGYQVMPFWENPILPGSYSSHPDLGICRVGSMVIISPWVLKNYAGVLSSACINYIAGAKDVQDSYPDDVLYNVFVNEKYAVGNYKYIDSVLGSVIDDSGINRIQVSQGYARCSIVPVRERACITDDIGIYKKLCHEQWDVLLVKKGDVLLPGQSVGFLGGATGIDAAGCLFFAGCLDFHHDGSLIRSFLEKWDMKYIELFNGPLYDVGSLIFF